LCTACADLSHLNETNEMIQVENCENFLCKAGQYKKGRYMYKVTAGTDPENHVNTIAL